MSNSAQHFYEFGPFRLDRMERVLFRADHPLTLTPKAFDLLLALVEQHGHVIEKEELMGTVWPETVVEESNLTHHISVLRKTLGESAGVPAYIETIPRRGYRFVAEVKEQNGVGATLVGAELATPISIDEKQPTAPPVKSRSQRITAILSILTLLLAALAGIGFWQYFRQEKNAQVRQFEFKGNFYLGRWTEDEIRKGIEYYNQAIALDPQSAAAYEGLAAGWNFLSDLHVSPREAMPKAKAAIVNALQRDDRSAQAHASLGVIKTQYEWDWAGAELEYKRALALAPEYEPAHRLYGWHLIAMGRFDEAQAEMKRSLESDPLNDWGLWGLGDSFYFARQYDQAIEQYRRAIGVEPRLYWTHLMLGCAYAQQGKFTEAITELNQAQRLNDTPQILAALGHVQAVSGQRAEAQRVLAELQEITKRRYVSPYDVATIYAGLGEKEHAMIWLEKAYEDRSGWLALWLKVDPKFDGLRTDPRFADLLRRIGLS